MKVLVDKLSSIIKTRVAHVPTVLQMEAVECGAAALAMVMAYHGKFLPLEKVREECGVSRDGVKASNIVKAARKYGFVAKGFRREPEQLKGMPMPLIIHWNFNHFVVLEGFKNDQAVINDPASGRRRISNEEFDQAFTGVVLTFEPTSQFAPSGEKPGLVKAVIKRTQGSQPALFFVILTGLLLVIPGLVIPAFTRIFIDYILLQGNLSWVRALIVGMVLTVMFQATLTWLQQHYLLKLENKIAVSYASKFLWHVFHLPLQFFAQRYHGDIASRLQSNDQAAQFLSGQLATSVLNLISAIFLFVLMLIYSWPLALVGLGAAIFNILLLKLISTKHVNENNRMLQDQGKLAAETMASLQIIETIKATGAENDFFARWAGFKTKLLNGVQAKQLYGQLLTTIPFMVVTLTNGITLILGARFVMQGQMSMGMLIAFLNLMTSFLRPVQGLMDIGIMLQETVGLMNRIDDVMNYPAHYQSQLAPSESAEDASAEESADSSAKLSGFIEMKNISFGYSPLDQPLIDNFNLRLAAGARVALVGGSGSGKSTIVKLLCGLYQPWEGQILFDGRERTSFSQSILAASMAVVEQEPVLFEGTIKSNITLWDDTISEFDVIRAARDAGIHQEIIARDGGYEHRISEGGRNFSGGQRQRLEIARALATNPTVLVLDEATSALDPITEKLIDNNIRKRGCTCLIVAHRLSTIRDCDEIIVMKEGKIVERGTHDELVTQQGHYTTLIASRRG